MPYKNIREEELKNKVAHDYFHSFDCTKIIGNIIFVISLTFFLYACNNDPSPLPCISIEDELENTDNVKAKLFTSYEIDSNGISKIYDQKRYLFNEEGILVSIETRNDTAIHFNKILNFKNLKIVNNDKVIDFFDESTKNNIRQILKISENGKISENRMFESNNNIYSEKYYYDSQLREIKRNLSFGEGFEATIKKSYSTNGSIQNVRVSNDEGKSYQYKYFQDESKNDYKCFKYLDQSNKVIKTEFLKFDSRNNPISKKAYKNGVFIWGKIIEYEYYDFKAQKD